MDEPLKAIDQVSTTAIDLAMRFGPRVLVAILILVAGYHAGRWAGRAALAALARLHLDPPVRGLLEKVVRVFVLALFGIMALQKRGVELLPLIAGLSVAGYAPARAELQQAILQAFRSRNIVIPLPQREVRMLPA